MNYYKELSKDIHDFCSLIVYKKPGQELSKELKRKRFKKYRKNFNFKRKTFKHIYINILKLHINE